MNLLAVIRENPRLTALAPRLADDLGPYLVQRPNARVHWVEEYARAVVRGSAHRAGIVAIAADAVVLNWKHGLTFKKRSLVEVPRIDVIDWELGPTGLTVETASGDVMVEFRPGSAELAGFSERFGLIRPFGRR